MKLQTKLALGLIATLFAVSLASAADTKGKMGRYDHGKYCDHMGMMSGDMGKDSVARANKHLGELKAKLNLTKEQLPAWQTFSDQVNDLAKNMTSMQDMMQSMPKTAPEQMAKMADLMKGRAQDMSKMADHVKTFYATLTPEQQAAFDKMHMSQMNQMGQKRQMK